MNTVTKLSQLYVASRRLHESPINPADLKQAVTHLALHTAAGIQLIAISEVSRVESDSNYCIIYCTDGHRHVASRTLRAVEALLPADQFARVHQSHLVRISLLKVVHKDEVVLINGDRLPLSRSQRSAILEQLQGFSARI